MEFKRVANTGKERVRLATLGALLVTLFLPFTQRVLDSIAAVAELLP
jgi:hypothetical protein